MALKKYKPGVDGNFALDILREQLLEFVHYLRQHRLSFGRRSVAYKEQTAAIEEANSVLSLVELLIEEL